MFIAEYLQCNEALILKPKQCLFIYMQFEKKILRSFKQLTVYVFLPKQMPQRYFFSFILNFCLFINLYFFILLNMSHRQNLTV